MVEDVNGLAYHKEDAPTENGYQEQNSEEQWFFQAHRERVYAYWQSRAEHKKRRAERTSSFKVTDTLY